jgi:fibronectin type 3 domain-containing protein
MIRRIIKETIMISVLFVLGACGTSGTNDAENIQVTTSSSQTNSGAPAAPTAVVLTNSGANHITVSWPPVSSAYSYNLYWSTSSGVTVANGTKIANVSAPYTHTGLTAGTVYYYIITAVNSSGESAPSGQVTATAIMTPVAPSGVSVSAGTNTAVVSWNAVSGAASYNVYWSASGSVSKVNGTKISNLTSAQFTHAGLNPNITYYYIVTAVNGVGESTPTAQVSVTTATVSGSLPAAPSGVSASGATNQASITWGSVSGATSYNLYWSDTSHVMKNMSPRITGVSSPYRHTALSAATGYFYAVTALNASGESLESAVVTATTSSQDGVALYGSSCASCHGTLTASGKKGTTALQIQVAINGNRGGMGTLSTLSAEQIQAITDVLAW